MRATWLARWNEMTNTPFKFHQTCSCKVGTSKLGMHLTTFVGNSLGIDMPPCSHVPTIAGATQSAETALRYLAEYLVSRVTGRASRPTGTDRHLFEGSWETSPTGCSGQPRYDAHHKVMSDHHASRIETQTHPSSVDTRLIHPTESSSSDELPVSTIAMHPEPPVPLPHFPTDQKERERDKKNALKAQGIEKVVKKTIKVVEEHYDDCGEDISSISTALPTDDEDVLFCDYDTDEELQDQIDSLALLAYPDSLAFPIDLTKIAQPQNGLPHSGRDSRAPPPKDSPCKGCKHYRSRDDWEHTRVIGECCYPYDKPFIPHCPACQDRKPLSLIHISEPTRPY